MQKESLIIITVISLLIIFLFLVLAMLKSISKRIEVKEKEIISLFLGKINKIPSLVEIMRKYIRHQDIFEEIIYLHKLWIIYNIRSVYDLLDLNDKIHREFIFLMKLSTKINELQKDGNFLYVRNYVMFYEKNIEKEISMIDILIRKHNNLRKLKNYSIIWLLWPVEKRIEF